MRSDAREHGLIYAPFSRGGISGGASLWTSLHAVMIATQCTNMSLCARDCSPKPCQLHMRFCRVVLPQGCHDA